MKTKYWYWIWKTFLGPSRLRRKFVRVFLLSGLVPLVLMGLVSVYLVNLTHRIDVIALEENLARRVASDITKTIAEIQSDFDLTVSFEEFAPINFDQQGFVLEGLLRENEGILDISFICTTPLQCDIGRETSRWDRNPDETFQENTTLRNRVQDTVFLDTQNNQETGYIGPIIFDAEVPYLEIASPVFNKTGGTIAVLTGKLNLESFQTIIEETILGETGYIYLINNEMRIIAHPDELLLGTNASLVPAVQFLFAEANGTSADVDLVYDNFNGELVSGSGNFIEELEWGVVAEWPRAETQRLIYAIIGQIAVFALLSLLIIAIIASWVAFKLIQPIAALRQGTSVIGSGNFDYRVSIKTGDELEDLGKNLNKMAENLKGLKEVDELRLRTELLSESLRKEKELSKLKDQFITTVSHQFNTPLTAINWAISGLKEKNNQEQFDESIHIIEKSQRDIGAIVNDLVTLADVGFQYQSSKTAQVDLHKLVQGIIDRFKDVAALKKITLSFELKSGSPLAEINEFTLSKAIENLIDNAIGYSNEGGTITITLEDTKDEVILIITDQGIGIPENDKSSIFQQFFRAKNAVVKKNVGTGLGLFIAKTITEGHGGKLWFESTENKGSSFHMTLPKKTIKKVAKPNSQA